MCNLYTQTKSVDEIASLFRELQMPLRFPEGVPNLKPGDVSITDPAPIVRNGPAPGDYELVVRRWSWPSSHGKPLYNLRSEGRRFSTGRCLVLADGFYEFTAPADARQKRKDRWLFSWRGEPVISIAGLVRANPQVGEAFTLLTIEPGADVAPYHHRQVALLPPAKWRDWLDGTAPESDLLSPPAEGSLEVRRAARAE